MCKKSQRCIFCFVCVAVLEAERVCQARAAARVKESRSLFTEERKPRKKAKKRKRTRPDTSCSDRLGRLLSSLLSDSALVSTSCNCKKKARTRAGLGAGGGAVRQASGTPRERTSGGVCLQVRMRLETSQMIARRGVLVWLARGVRTVGGSSGLVWRRTQLGAGACSRLSKGSSYAKSKGSWRKGERARKSEKKRKLLLCEL